MTQTNQSPARTLRRSRHDRMIAGVCGGIARHFGLDAGMVRIVLAVATLLGFGTGILIYLTCWALMPEEH